MVQVPVTTGIDPREAIKAVVCASVDDIDEDIAARGRQKGSNGCGSKSGMRTRREPLSARSTVRHPAAQESLEPVERQGVAEQEALEDATALLGEKATLCLRLHAFGDGGEA